MKSFLLLIAAAIFAAPAVSAGPREETIQILDSIESTWRQVELEAMVNKGRFDEHPVGEEITYRVRTSQDCFLTVISIDSHGVGSFVVPSGLVSDHRLSAGTAKAIPDDRYYLDAAPPLGLQTVYFVATKVDVSSSVPSGLAEPGILVPIEATRMPQVVESLRQSLSSLPSGSVAVRRTDQRIVARSEEGEYSKVDVVKFFTERKRYLERPTLDAHINFAFDSAELTPEAIEALAPIGEGFSDPQLETDRFVIGGHTDSVGPEEYNLDLSRRRATSARHHLEERYGVAPSRLGIQAYGESKPLEENDTARGRSQNRRVEFQLVRE